MARVAGDRGLSSGQLAATLRIDPLQIEPVLETLVAFDWVGQLDEARDPRFVLLCDPGRTPAQPLLAQLLMEPSPVSRALWQRAGFDTMTVQELLQA